MQSHRKRPKSVTLWARLLGAAAAGLVLIASNTADVPVARVGATPAFASRPDPRIARLERFFRIYHCPAPLHTNTYLRAADGYGLDYRLLPAVSIRETLCGVSARRLNNRWGYHTEEFPSIEAGIDFLARRLTQHPLYKGKTLQGILFTYNPLPAYPEEVRRIMRQIE
jgi:hypothetical protein